MQPTFTRFKPVIDVAFQKFLSDKGQEVSEINQWALDATKRFSELGIRGKSVRGAIFLNVLQELGVEIISAHVQIAVALELLHTAVLIHDDIIDHDRSRRGLPSLFVQYETLGKEQHVPSLDFGKNMSIVAADLGFFWAFELLSSLTIADTNLTSKIIHRFAYEFGLLGLGEMQDVFIAGSVSIPKEKDILSLYTYKTARYTFSLPFMLAGMVSHQSDTDISILQTLGESLGMIFQLKDDELGLFGNPKQTGKPVGNDIRENKKTLYILRLLPKLTAKEKERVEHILGNENCTEEDIQYVRTLVIKYEVKKNVSQTMENYISQANDLTTQLSFGASQKKVFADIQDFLLSRTV